MEQIIETNPVIIHPIETADIHTVKKNKPFIEANTIEMEVQEIRDKHIIPVFTRDNEPLISHAEFIDAMYSVASQLYEDETLLDPVVRVSHAVKGRM